MPAASFWSFSTTRQHLGVRHMTATSAPTMDVLPDMRNIAAALRAHLPRGGRREPVTAFTAKHDTMTAIYEPTLRMIK
jgi:hypothetical protein